MALVMGMSVCPLQPKENVLNVGLFLGLDLLLAAQIGAVAKKEVLLVLADSLIITFLEKKHLISGCIAW